MSAPRSLIAQVIGGLGNQMFQYASAKAISRQHGVRLKIDISGFANYPLRPFLLDQFTLSFEEPSAWESLLIRVSASRLGRLLPQDIRIRPVREQTHAHHSVNLPTSGTGVYLIGYWQSEKYFNEISEEIRADFTVRSKPSPINEALLTKIRASEAISLHVRRGDYVSNPVAAAYHGTCSLDYYREAIKILLQRVQSPHFFVFSDDIPWVRENLRFDHTVTFVDHNGDAPWEDIRLMSACRHFVIANSSFSWWGAWLSKHPSKTVIAPRRWFLTEEKDDCDQVPDSWIRI
jgi:hypothetical protein